MAIWSQNGIMAIQVSPSDIQEFRRGVKLQQQSSEQITRKYIMMLWHVQYLLIYNIPNLVRGSDSRLGTSSLEEEKYLFKIFS